MELKIYFVNGDFDDATGCYIADFYVEDNIEHDFLGYRGMHYAYHDKNNKFIRRSGVYVVKQHNLWKTLKVLAHELCHALIWLLFLPDKWSSKLDRT